MKIATELCIKKFRVRRSLQKNDTKNKKRNDKKKKESRKDKKKNKKEKNDKRKEKKTSKGKKNKNLKNKPKAENNSKKCKVKKSKLTKKVRSKRAGENQDPDKDPGQSSSQDLCQDLTGTEITITEFPENTVVTLFEEIPEFDPVIKEITNCFLTPASVKDRFYNNFFHHSIFNLTRALGEF